MVLNLFMDAPCLEVATFESRVAELKPCVPELEMYTSEQLQTHAVTAA